MTSSTMLFVIVMTAVAFSGLSCLMLLIPDEAWVRRRHMPPKTSTPPADSNKEPTA